MSIYKEAIKASRHSTDYEAFCDFLSKLSPEVYEKVIKMSLKEFDELVAKGEISHEPKRIKTNARSHC